MVRLRWRHVAVGKSALPGFGVVLCVCVRVCDDDDDGNGDHNNDCATRRTLNGSANIRFTHNIPRGPLGAHAEQHNITIRRHDDYHQ